MIRSLFITLVFIFAGTMFASTVRASDDLPPVFDTRPYAEAKKAAQTEKKWFIVKGTAVWCGPCKQMDKTTWRDEKVVEWMKKNAIVVALDVDKEQEIAKELDMPAIPTMVAFKEGGTEFDRVVGYKSPDAMLGWVEGIAKGEKSIEAVKKRAKAPAAKGGDMQARLELARALSDDGEPVKAADEYAWLWKNMLQHDPAMVGVRVSFMAGDMERLAKQNKDARAKFVSLRDETGKRLEGEKIAAEDFADWVILNNRVLNDSDATLKLVDRVKDQPRWQPLMERMSRELSEMFINLHRWADAGRLLQDPLAKLDFEWQITKMGRGQAPKEIDEQTRKMLEDISNKSFRKNSSQQFAALLAAGRDELADKFAAKAREYDPSIEMLKGLIETALEAEQPRPAHKEWIEAAKDETLKKLATRVEKAMEKKQQAK